MVLFFPYVVVFGVGGEDQKGKAPGRHNEHDQILSFYRERGRGQFIIF